MAIETLIKFLRHTGVMDNNFGEDIISNEIVSSNQIEVFKVGEIVTIKTNNFNLKKIGKASIN